MTLNSRDFEHLNLMADLENEPVEETNYADMVIYEPERTAEPSLSENILALCGKLRSSGFDKHAESLENKFAQFKLTNLKYDPVINQAHPQGDFEAAPNKDDLGDVETLISQQEKDLEVVNRAPTGKVGFIGLSGFKTSLADYVFDCKLALAEGTVQDMLPKAQAEAQLNQKMIELNTAIDQINEKVKGELTLPLSDYTDTIKELSKSPTLDNLNAIRERYEQLIARLHPQPIASSAIKSTIWTIYNTVGTIGLTDDTWEVMEREIKAPLKIINDALSLRKTIIAQNDVKTLDEVTVKSNPAEVVLNKCIQDIRSYETLLKNNLVKNITDDEKAKALSWIEEERKELYELRTNYNNIIESPNYDETIINALNAKIEEAKSFVAKFYNDWIK